MTPSTKSPLESGEWFAVSTLARHTGKHWVTIWRAMQATGVKTHKLPGIRGLRITGRDARRFLALHWPDVAPLPSNTLQ